MEGAMQFRRSLNHVVKREMNQTPIHMMNIDRRIRFIEWKSQQTISRWKASCFLTKLTNFHRLVLCEYITIKMFPLVRQIFISFSIIFICVWLISHYVAPCDLVDHSSCRCVSVLSKIFYAKPISTNFLLSKLVSLHFPIVCFWAKYG